MGKLKARILEIVEDYEEGISVLDNDMAQAGIDPKSDFVNTIEQLLEERECRAREEGRREVLEDMKKMWDNDNLGDAPKYGSAGAGLMKGWIRDDINERLSKLTTK